MVDHECVFVQSSPPPGVPHAPQYQGCVCILCVLPPSAVLWKAPCPIRTTTEITANDKFLRFMQIGAERSFSLSPPPPKTVNDCIELQLLTSASSYHSTVTWKLLEARNVSHQAYLLLCPSSPWNPPPQCPPPPLPDLISLNNLPSLLLKQKHLLLCASQSGMSCLEGVLVCNCTCNLTCFPLFCCVQPSSPWPFLCAVLWDFTSLQEAV